MAYTKSKFDKVMLGTPAGIAVWPDINRPSTRFNKNGEFKCDLAFDKDDPELAEFKAKLLAIAREQMEKIGILEFDAQTNPEGFKIRLPIKPERDKERKMTGRMIIRSKLQHKVQPRAKDGEDAPPPFYKEPAIYSADLKVEFARVMKPGEERPLAPNIASGSKLVLSATLRFTDWEKEDDDDPEKMIRNFYVSFPLDGVQIITLVERAKATPDAYGVVAVEGYTPFAADESVHLDDDEAPPESDAGY